MKKLVCLLGIIAALMLLNSCTMKECKCLNSNLCIHNDSIDPRSDTVYTVYNYTRTDCEEFNKEDTIKLDSVTFIYHSIHCQEN